MEEQEKKQEKTDQPTEAPVAPQAVKPVIHTYADDLAKALDTTDASVVQELFIEGKEREDIEEETKRRGKQKGWYTTGATILIVFSLGAVLYTAYHYTHLTVAVKQHATVGVFPSTKAVVADTTDIRALVTSLRADPSFEANKPALVPVVHDEQSLVLLSNSELFSFFESKPSEPFLASFDLVRLGVMNTGTDTVPFIIGSIPDTDIASKEFLIAEPDMLQLLYKPLGIDVSTIPQEVGRSFVGGYMYNIPVRTFSYTTEGGISTNVFFYARVSDHIVVFTTNPSVLKAIYDTLIRQQ